MGRRAGAWPRRLGRCCLSSPDGNHRCCPSSRSTAGAAAGCSAGPATPTEMWPWQRGPAPRPRHEPFLSPRVQFAVLQPRVRVSPPVPPIPPSLLRVRLGTRAAQALRTPASAAGNDLHLLTLMEKQIVLGCLPVLGSKAASHCAVLHQSSTHMAISMP